MTTSGTAAFNLDLVEIVEEAFERCGLEVRSGYDLRTARRSMNLMFADWANRGLNMWTMEQGSIVLVPGTRTYSLPNDTVDLLEHVIRTGTGQNQVEIAMARISLSSYATIPTKETQGKPIQVLVNRTINPSVTVWPVPDTNGPYTLVYWRLRRMQDAGDGTNTMDVPFRFLPCMVAGLAYHLCLKLPGAGDRLNVLKAQYDEAWMAASDEDREKASVRLVPRIGW